MLNQGEFVVLDWSFTDGTASKEEVEAAVSSTLDFWRTLGTEGEAFQKELASFLGVRHSLLVNSGSSANLVAISALTSHACFSRTELAQELDRHQISNRMLFGGNLLCQPAFVELHHDRPESFRVVGEMPGSDVIMSGTLFLGTYPGLTQEMLLREIKVITDFLATRKESPSVAHKTAIDSL
jgi:hypothetical protein